MPERTRDLHQTLAELQQQLASGGPLDSELREELRAALEAIRARMAAGEAPERPVLDRIRQLMLHFEAEHPALADAAGAVVRALARLGI